MKSMMMRVWLYLLLDMEPHVEARAPITVPGGT